MFMRQTCWGARYQFLAISLVSDASHLLSAWLTDCSVTSPPSGSTAVGLGACRSAFRLFL